MASPAGFLWGREVMLLEGSGVGPGVGRDPHLGSSGHWVQRPPRGDNGAVASQLKPWEQPGCLSSASPRCCGSRDQRGGEAAGSQPEVETLCFLWVFLKLLFGPVANPVGGTGVRN